MPAAVAPSLWGGLLSLVGLAGFVWYERRHGNGPLARPAATLLPLLAGLAFAVPWWARFLLAVLVVAAACVSVFAPPPASIAAVEKVLLRTFAGAAVSGRPGLSVDLYVPWATWTHLDGTPRDMTPLETQYRVKITGSGQWMRVSQLPLRFYGCVVAPSIAAAAALTGAVLPLTWPAVPASWLRGTDLVVALAGAIWCGCDTEMSVRDRQRWLMAGEAAVLVVLCGSDSALRHGGDHLTWWGVAAVALLDVSILCGARQPMVGIQAMLSAVVLLGTHCLSLFKCSMLSETFAAMGPLGYVIGNVLIHYYPATRALISVEAGERISDGAAAAVFALACAYSVVVDPATVYGCFDAARAGAPILSLIVWVISSRKQ